MANALKRYRLYDDDKLDLSRFDPSEHVLDAGDRDAIDRAQRALQEEIGDLQNRLFAEGRRSLLLVLQGMDTSGKDGVTIATFSGTHPQGVVVTPFKVPSADEAAHDFLWRIHARVPARGMIAVFNRSHYEAVVAERVLGLASVAECKRRYGQINAFEQMLVEQGTTVLKCFLHLSPDEQKKRLQSRIDEESKHWKFNPNDLVERKRWSENMNAYTDSIRRTSTKAAPWWVVPADSKSHRNLMVATLVRDALAKIDPKYPPLPPAYASIEVE